MAHPPVGPLSPGARFAGHRIESLAGVGASATVYRAVHEDSLSLRALKVSHEQTPEGGADGAPPDMQTIRLQHPDIAQVHDAGTFGGRPWQSMEWVPGHDLTRYTAAHRLLPRPLALETVARLARATAYAHRAGVTHRDIKPGNVRIHLPAGLVKLGDFGIARMPDASVTRTGLLQGTPAYMAPEMLSGATASAATDLYALGVILYELLTAHRPHEAASLGALLKLIGTAPPPRLRTWLPEAPERLEALLTALLSPRPEQRPPDGDVLADELDALSGSERRPAP
jgi:eukaryotic-like serine/threonine-protein kinase